MPRKVKNRSLDSREARSRLKPRGVPYFAALDKNSHVGYRRLKGKSGTWWGRHYGGNQKYESLEFLGIADDSSTADGIEILDFWQASAKWRERLAQKTLAAAGADGKIITVALALDRYETNLKARGSDLSNVARVRTHLPEALASKPVGTLTADDFTKWRDGLLKQIVPASVDRVCNAFRAGRRRQQRCP